MSKLDQVVINVQDRGRKFRVDFSPLKYHMPCYGTGGYRACNLDAEGQVEHCMTLNEEWISVDDWKKEINIYVIKGDKAWIGQLVKTEVEHFDTEVTLVIK